MRNSVCFFVIVCLAVLNVTPRAGQADSDENGIPSWVPITVAGAVVVGGIFYFLSRDRSSEKTPNEAALDLIYYISTEKERDELKGLITSAEVSAFMERFWQSCDPTPGTQRNEFREEHKERFLHANKEFCEHDEGWKSDRGRVYILYGPPAEVRHYVMTNVPSGIGSPWKSVELWEYARLAGGNRLLPLLTDPKLFKDLFGEPLSYGGRMVFLFGSQTGAGSYDQLFSTEPGEKIDPRIY